MESKKRERASNFNNNEVQLLVNLVEKYKFIIENKKTDAITNKDKESAWIKIESAFNSCGVTANTRSWKTLKLKYEGLKKNTRKKSSIQRQDMYKTGGGPSTAPELNYVEEKLLSICSNIKGLDARHDSDTISQPVLNENFVFVNTTNVTDNIENQNTIEKTDQDNIKLPDMDESIIIEINEEEEESQKENKWDRWHPKALKSRVSNVLRADTVTKGTVTAKLDQLSSTRLKLVEFQMDCTKKEHQFVEEEHKLKMLHYANDEKRKQELHELLIDKIRRAPVVNGMI